MLSKLRLPWAMLMGLALLLSATACDNDDDDIMAADDRTIVDIAADDPQFSTLVSALQRTGLDAVLADRNAAFTVFAPTNTAFTNLGVDLTTLSDDELSDILLYHVLGAEVMSSQILEGQTYVTTASASGPGDTQLSALIERVGTLVTINGSADVAIPDVDAVNGVIHVIDEVLLPLDLVGHASANSNFSSLVSALGTATGDLVNVLQSTDQDFTVFAPLNSAFDAASAVTATLTPEQLSSVLTYHVVGGANVVSSTLSDGQSVLTVQGESFTINISGNNVSIMDARGEVANIVLVDVQATNGVIHVLDKIILPVTL